MTVRIMVGNCITSMRTLIDEGVRVQTVVTSPPYYGLRQYIADDAPEKPHEIGLESSPAEFIAKLVDVFEVVRELLADDGTLWLNMGDSYAGAGYSNHTLIGHGAALVADGGKQKHGSVKGIKSKDLMGMPWRLAFALQDAGWYLRQDIIWSKPNPMPESVTDRCTKAHEYLFLLTKQARYYYDAAAIAEPASVNTHERRPKVAGWATSGDHSAVAWATDQAQGVGRRLPGNQYHKGTTEYEAGVEHHRTKGGLVDYARKLAAAASGTKNNASFDEAMAVMPAMRNKRSVWTIASEAFSEAHFATFPTKLVEPCILAGSRPGDLVLDPFGGSGTTGLVADALQRDAVLCELNPEYAAMARRRIVGGAPLFAEVA